MANTPKSSPVKSPEWTAFTDKTLGDRTPGLASPVGMNHLPPYSTVLTVTREVSTLSPGKVGNVPNGAHLSTTLL